MDYTKQIFALAEIGYTVTQVVNSLNLSSALRKQVLLRIKAIDDTYNRAYLEGKAKGERAIDKQLYEMASNGDVNSIEAIQEKIKEKKISELRYKLFGI